MSLSEACKHWTTSKVCTAADTAVIAISTDHVFVFDQCLSFFNVCTGNVFISHLLLGFSKYHGMFASAQCLCLAEFWSHVCVWHSWVQCLCLALLMPPDNVRSEHGNKQECGTWVGQSCFCWLLGIAQSVFGNSLLATHHQGSFAWCT